MDFQMPEIGEGVQEGEIVSWLVKVGDSVSIDQPLVEVMTDKATVEIPAPVAGVVKELKAQEGDMVAVGASLVTLEEGAASAEAPAAESAPEEKTAETQSNATPVAPEAPAPQAAATASPTPATQKPPAPQSPSPVQQTSAYAEKPQDFLNTSHVPAAPIVRAMAQKQGVSLNQVPGTGPQVGGQNRVLEEDLLRFIEQRDSHKRADRVSTPNTAPSSTGTTPQQAPAPSKSIPATQVYGDEVVERQPLRGLRRAIAKGMVQSKFTAPHFSYVDEFECTELIELRKKAKETALQYGIKFSYLPFIVKAVVAALKEFPQVNSSLEELPDGKMEMVYKKFFNIGIAVATPDGLLVPVIKHADQKSLLEIAREINELSEKVRAGQAKPEELKGSTFTITSMGNIGGLFATPIINYPEVGILGVYKIQEKPVVKNSEIVVGNTMNLSLSLDHRVVDGAVGGYFCNAIIERLAQPSKLMLEM